MWLGRHIESKLSEYHNGKPVYTIQDLLGDTPKSGKEAALAMFGSAFGVIGNG